VIVLEEDGCYGGLSGGGKTAVCDISHDLMSIVTPSMNGLREEEEGG